MMRSRAVLQPLIWPHPEIHTDPALYFRIKGPAFLDRDAQRIEIQPGASVATDRYFNLFPLSDWQRYCGLSDLGLRIEGAGRIGLTVAAARSGSGAREVIATQVIELSEGMPVEISLPSATDARGVAFVTATALEAGHLSGLEWVSADAPRRQPDIVVVMTTFRREAEARRVAAQFSSRLGSEGGMRLLVVDNGRSLDLPDLPGVERVANENLGGAGGFARGILEARKAAASHCLFMDDDASAHPESLARVAIWLAYVEDPNTAIAGAMIDAGRPWALWEAGARFDGLCDPLHFGVDLRDSNETLQMAVETSRQPPALLYGGWWLFAFPLAPIRHLPFPFFVRGDDVSFSLANPLKILRPPGIASFQEGFTARETPLNTYLDLRSHLAHLLSLPAFETQGRGVGSVALRFFLLNLMRMRYGALEAINVALDDVLSGPETFGGQGDLSDRRKQMAELRERDGRTLDGAPAERVRIDPSRSLPRLLMKITLNGHLIPGFRLFGNRIVLAPQDNGRVRDQWGAAMICLVDAESGAAALRVHNKALAAAAFARFLPRLVRLVLRRRRLAETWRGRYGDLTSEAYWRQALGLIEVDPTTAVAAGKEDDGQLSSRT